MALSALKGWYPFIRLITLILSAFAFALTAALFPIIDDSPWYTGVYGELHPASVAPPMAGFSWSMFYSAFILVFMCTGGTSHPCVDVGIDLISWLLNMGSGVWTVLLIQGLEGSIASWVCDDFLEPANPHDCSNARKIDGFWNTSAVVSLLVGYVHSPKHRRAFTYVLMEPQRRTHDVFPQRLR